MKSFVQRQSGSRLEKSQLLSLMSSTDSGEWQLLPVHPKSHIFPHMDNQPALKLCEVSRQSRSSHCQVTLNGIMFSGLLPLGILPNFSLFGTNLGPKSPFQRMGNLFDFLNFFYPEKCPRSITLPSSYGCRRLVGWTAGVDQGG